MKSFKCQQDSINNESVHVIIVNTFLFCALCKLICEQFLYFNAAFEVVC